MDDEPWCYKHTNMTIVLLTYGTWHLLCAGEGALPFCLVGTGAVHSHMPALVSVLPF